MPPVHGEFSAAMQTGLGVYYLLAAFMNLGFAAAVRRKNVIQTGLWSLVAVLFFILAVANLVHLGWVLNESIKNFVIAVMNPVSYFLLAVGGLMVVLYFRKFLTLPPVVWAVLQMSLLLGGWAMTDANFRRIIAKPDNVAIVILIYSVGFTTWLALRQAVVNDDRLARGEPPLEKLEEDKVLVWPDLVYIELIAMVVCTFLLIVWSVYLKAPLEQPASTSHIPNPSKAPWYFLGLQEMLVYFDPWMAGVVLPTLIIIGLIALPYIDCNPKGSGYYTFVQRKFAVTMFMAGFLVLWVTLIVLGTFLRGPNWSFFALFEPWDLHKNVPLINQNLSDIFWRDFLGMAIEGRHWFIRELPGIVLVLAYLLLLPPLLAKTVMRSFFIKMGLIRFILLVTLIQFMAALPIKMVLRWTINLQYIVFIREYAFNI